MSWRPYPEEDRQYALAVSRERFLGLSRSGATELLAILTKYTNAPSVNWTAAVMEVHRALGDVTSAYAEVAWALLPFIVRANDIHGGGER
jgi:hypothetical protein